jgi:hypothetical protein
VCVVGDAQRSPGPAGEVKRMGHEWDKDKADQAEQERREAERKDAEKNED